MVQQKLERIQALLDEMVAKQYVAGVNCLVIQNGEEQGYFQAGYRDLEAKKAIARDTIFSLYSMSKPITAAATMCLLEQGKIDLFDEVSDYLPCFRQQNVWTKEGVVPAQNRMKIKDLLMMTSGLIYGEDTELGRQIDGVFEQIKVRLLSPKPMTTMEVAEVLASYPLAFEPGTHWHYGTSADILGALIEQVAQMPFGDYLKQQIFEPLGMVDTGFTVPKEKQDRLSKVYQETPGGLSPYTDNNLGILIARTDQTPFESGGAGLVGTIDDYAAFAQMLMNRGHLGKAQILSPKTVDYMTSCYLTQAQQADVWDTLAGYSYGNLMRVMTQPGLAIFNGSQGEYGWDGWLGTYFVNDPVNHLTFLLMQQRRDSGTTSYIRKIRNVLTAALAY